MSDPYQSNADGRKFSAVGFLIQLWEERLFLTLFTGFVLLLALLYVVLSPPKYSATILIGHVTPVDAPGSSGSLNLGGALSLFGGGGHIDTKFDLFLTIIKTEKFARFLDRKYHFVQHAPAEEKISNVNALTGVLRSLVVTQNAESNTATLTIQSRNRDFAGRFLGTVFAEGNEAVRRIDTERAQKFASYVEERFKSEPNRAMQDALGSLLVTQERFLMVTKVNLPYAAQLLDGPTVSDRPTSPRKTLILAIGLLVGLSLALTVLLIWDAITDERRGRGLETPGLSEAMLIIVWTLKERLGMSFGRRHRSHNVDVDQQGV